MACSVRLCGRFADSQQSRFQSSKRSNMGSAVTEGVRIMIFTNSVFKLLNVQIRTVSNCKGVYLLIDRNGIFRPRNVQIIAVPSRKTVDLLMFTNSGLMVRNVEIRQCCPAMKFIF